MAVGGKPAVEDKIPVEVSRKILVFAGIFILFEKKKVVSKSHRKWGIYRKGGSYFFILRHWYIF
jgi:hypothetical protein